MNNLSIILPVFNEVNTLEYVVSNWHTYLSSRNIQHEFVICEDGSTDGTKELIKQLELKYPISSQSTTERRGYGGGVIAGLKAAKYDYILCIDSDGQCMPDSFDTMYRIREYSEIVIGIRKPRKDPFIRIIYSFLFYILHSLLFRSHLKDPSCPYVLAKKETYLKLLPKLNYMREGFWWGFIGAAVLHKLKIAQVKIVHYQRYDGSTVVYKLSKMPGIIIRNMIGLIRLRISEK